jgi:hypothetical protein
MRKLVFALAFSTAAFAGSTWYLAHQLALERERHPSVAAAQNVTPPAEDVSGSPATAANPADGATPRPTAQAEAPASTPRPGPMTEADFKKAQADFSRRFLAQLADPQGREELLAERKMMMRHSYPRIAQVVGLSAEEYARFIELSALEQLDIQEASSRCALEPGCNSQDVFRNRMDEHGADIRDLLGPERLEKLANYKSTMSEREVVTQLRSRLPDAQRLNDDKAESLVAALAEEREALHREAAVRGSNVSGFGMGAGMIFSPNDGRPLEERYEAAMQYSQRLRDRAAQVLDGEQLRAFNEMQDETLLGLRSMMRNKDNMGFSALTVTQ